MEHEHHADDDQDDRNHSKTRDNFAVGESTKSRTFEPVLQIEQAKDGAKNADSNQQDCHAR